MPIPPNKKDPSQASASDEEADETFEDEEEESESSSNVPKDKMKGDKPNPLRKWAETETGDF